MRKKLDTRFPAARIKKIMQADEDIGKIALAVPVLVSKALELFLQDLCDHTYDITLRRGAKTMNALHLKHCVHSYNVFDFLRDVVSRVPDYGHGYGHGHSESGADDRAVLKRRKAAGYNYSDSDEESKRSKHGLNHTGSTGRGRGRGRRSRGRGARTVQRDNYHQEIEPEPCTFVQHNSNHKPNASVMEENGSESKESPKENIAIAGEGSQSLTKIDLNSNTNEDVNKNAGSTAHATLPEPATETKLEEIPGWSISGVDNMAIDSMQLAQLGRQLEEEEEDYDEEE